MISEKLVQNKIRSRALQEIGEKMSIKFKAIEEIGDNNMDSSLRNNENQSIKNFNILQVLNEIGKQKNQY